MPYLLVSKNVKCSFAWFLLAGFLFAWERPVFAERYLTIPEAQKLCFPQADRFEAQTVRFSAEQIKAIEKRSEGKARNTGNKIWTAWQGTNLLGVLVLDHVFGKHQIIDYAVAISPEGKAWQIEILEYRESYGGEIRGKKWREQFRGKTAGQPLRLNEDIYNISGATMSCRSVAEGVKRVLATFEIVLRPLLASSDKLSKPADAKP